MNIIDYHTAGGKNLILAYIDKMSIVDKAIGYSIREKIHRDGIFAFEALDTRQLKKKLWEIKFSFHRLMYVVVDNDNIYFVHICKKQKNKAEQNEINKAIARIRELENELHKKFI